MLPRAEAEVKEVGVVRIKVVEVVAAEEEDLVGGGVIPMAIG